MGAAYLGDEDQKGDKNGELPQEALGGIVNEGTSPYIRGVQHKPWEIEEEGDNESPGVVKEAD